MSKMAGSYELATLGSRFIAILIDGKEYAKATGKSKKTAQQEAAQETIVRLKKELS